jgi:type I restriction enzyme S subunit
VNRLSAEIETQYTLLKQFRQAVLQEAIEGKLTAEWRKENPKLISEENHAARLLEKIKADKERLIKECKIKRPKPLPPISEDEEPFALPDGWVWTRLGSLVNPLRGITYGIVKLGNEPKTGGVYTLRTSDVKYRFIDTSKTRRVKDSISNNYKRTILQGGEILINVRGTLGGCAIVPEEIKGFNVSREVSVFSLLIKELNVHILNVVSSPYFNSVINKNLRGIAYKGLNLNLLSLLLVPLPPLSEQFIISNKVNRLMAKIAELEEQVKSSKAQAGQMMQSVLREAFEENS